MELPGLGTATLIVAAVGTVALVAAVVVPIRERASRGFLVGMALASLAAALQLILAVVQSHPGHAVAIVPLLVAGVVVLIRAGRTRRLADPTGAA